MRPTPLYRAYTAATRLVLPLAARDARRKLAAAGMADRAGEKLGHASGRRPDGTLIWVHAASVGESLSVLGLIDRLLAALPGAELLVTTGTPTSAKLMERRLPPRARHQFAPLDAPGPVARFLDHWRPNAAIFAESELWPQMIWRANEAGVPMALVNARMSQKSLARWHRRPDTARQTLSAFRLILTQTEALAEVLRALAPEGVPIRRAVNLKAVAAPLPVDDATVAEMRAALGERPVWVAASTHPGEEEEVLEAHASLLADRPDLCLILAPRHPERGKEVAALIATRGWPVARRSTGAGPEGPVYLADTLGELGNWYALTPFVFLGGSLRPVGGHNPYEVAQAGAAVLSGPHVHNFEETFATLKEAGGLQTVTDARTLARAAAAWLNDRDLCEAARAAATGFASQADGALDAVAETLIDALNLRRD